MRKVGFHEIEKQTMAQKIVDQIAHAIAQGLYKPGDRLPTEPELAQMFNCGRNSVREAVKILVAYGVLKIRRADGTFVSAGLNKAMVNPLIYGIILNSGSSKSEMIEFQREIDKAVSRLSAKNRTEKDVRDISAAYEALIAALKREPYDLQEVYAADRRYHDTVAQATHNEFMKLVNTAIWDLLGVVIEDEIRAIMHAEPSQMITIHQGQYESILRQDPNAAEEAIPASYFIERIRQTQ